MPKKVTMYQCEICGKLHKHHEDAVRCESLGTALQYPKGMIFADQRFRKCVFSIAHITIEGHITHIAAWACRDNGYGDSLGGACVGFTSCDIEPIEADQNTPAFKRMVSYLERAGINPNFWTKELNLCNIEAQESPNAPGRGYGDEQCPK